jgi:hypothetical protein
MTAKQVNINTQAHTQLTGSLIAATDTGDKDGNDNGQLSLTTNSLNASSLNTTTNYFCVFDVSVEEFGAGLGFGLGFRLGIGLGIGIGIVLVDIHKPWI